MELELNAVFILLERRVAENLYIPHKIILGFRSMNKSDFTIQDVVRRTLTIWLAVIATVTSAQGLTKLELESSTSIPGFPSASAIVCDDNRFFVMGDDSRHLMILDQQYHKLDSIQVFDGTEKRIPQNVKADIESGLMVGGKILLIGSSSSQARHRSYIIKLFSDRREKISQLNNKSWLPESVSTGPVNIEGAMTFNRKLVFANRTMKGVAGNFLFVTPLKPFLRGRSSNMREREIVIPDSITRSAGISDLCYVESDDLLLVTLSSEDSANPLEDGAIGPSYLGWIGGFSEVFKKGVLRLQGVVDLTTIDPAFHGQKIEGVCAQNDNDQNMILHLVSDNDDGVSRIFRVRMNRP